MLKTKFQKIYDRIMMSIQEPMFFGNLFKKLFLSFSNWYLFPEFRKGFLLPKLIKENILLFLLYGHSDSFISDEQVILSKSPIWKIN